MRLSAGLTWQVHRLSRFVELKGKTVLDVGCGFGDLALALEGEGVEKVLGIEPDRRWAGVAATRGLGSSPTSKVVIGVGEHLPFPENRFDLVILNQVAEHVRSVEHVVREIVRVLKAGGFCLINAPNYLVPYEPHYRVALIPYLPKRLGMCLLKLMGRDPKYLVESIFYVTPFAIMKALNRAGVLELTNVFHECIVHPELIMSRRWKKVAAIMRFVRLPSFVVYLLSPSFSILARKTAAAAD
jgi:ubiquinone/menaquinone biosynthesis C-methylase UbiE